VQTRATAARRKPAVQALRLDRGQALAQQGRREHGHGRGQLRHRGVGRGAHRGDHAAAGSAAPSIHPAALSGALLPLLAAALGTAAFVGIDATIKSLAPRFGAVQLTLFRFTAGLVFALALWAWMRRPMPARGQWRLHALRAILLLLSLTSYFDALTVLQLAQAVAMSYTAPIFISLLAMLLLKERPTRWIWLSLALGLGLAGTGTGVAMWPELQQAHNPRLEGLLFGETPAAATLMPAGLIVAGCLLLLRR
jgi:drug/metabolite transporter (DMT)-like permease